MSDLTVANAAELEAYEAKLQKQQAQKPPAKYNQIKIGFDPMNPVIHGKYIRQREGDTEWEVIGDGFEGVILASRHQYSFFSEKDKNENMFTEQFEDYSQPVRVTHDGINEQIKPISKWVKEKYPKKTDKEATYAAITYVLYEGEVYLFRVKGAHCSDWIEYINELDERELLFTAKTIFSHGQEKNGTVVYFPAEFERGAKLEAKEYQICLAKSWEVDKMISALNAGGPKVEVVEPDFLK